MVGHDRVVIDLLKKNNVHGEIPQQTIATTGVEYLATRSAHLWTLAIVFFGFGDLVTTGIGLSFTHTIEIGPLAAIAYHQSGWIAFPILKTFTIGMLYLIWLVIPTPHDTGIPLGLAVFGVLVTIWNVSVIISLL